MKLMNKEKKDMDKIMEDMNSDAVLDLLRSETGEDKEMVQAKRDLKVLDMFIKADVSARGSEALMDGSSKKSRSNKLREMILFMQQVLTAVKIGEGGMVYQVATDLSALSIYTTQAISVMAESPDKSTKRKIGLSSSHLPKDKTSKSSADGFAEVFKSIVQKYKSFYDYCLREDVSVEGMPNPEDISLNKFFNMCVISTDNASQAKKAAEYISEYLRRAKEAGIDQERLEKMTEEERAGLCLNLCFGCCAHLRNLIEKEMAQYESLIMGVLVPKQDKHMRVDESVDGCIRALRKLIAIAHDLYNKGKQREFQTFSKEHMSEEYNFYLGNADNGHRFDDSYEGSVPVVLMYDLAVYFLQKEAEEAGQIDANVLVTSLLVKLGSKEFKVALMVRCWFWFALFREFRFLTNKHDIGVSIYNVGEVFDRVLDFLRSTMDDPLRIARFGCSAFELAEFPDLIDFRAELQEKEVTSVGGQSRHFVDLLREKIYCQLDDEEKAIAEQLIYASCEGGIRSMMRNCGDLLSTTDGKFRVGSSLFDDVKEKLKGLHLTTLTLAEAVFGKAGYYFDKGVNFHVSTVDGLTTAKENGWLWDASDKWTEELSLALVRWAMTNYKELKKELNALIERQRKADVERQKQKEMNFVKKNLKKYEHIVSHWGTPRVHELKSREQLDDVLKTVADKKKLLTNIINTILIGYGASSIVRKISLTGMSLNSLKETAVELIEKGIKKPETPPLPKKDTAKPEDYGMRTSRQLSEAKQKFQSKIEKALKKINEEHELYFTDLEFSWDQISRPYWSQELSDRQKMFTRGAVFVEDEDEPILKRCAGMSYDTDKKDYYVLYHDYDKSPKRTDDEDVDFSYFNEQRAYRKRNEYIEGINDWKYLKFLDPTQVEGFKQARDKRQYLSEVTMCPKAIYTLDLTSDIDVDS